MLELFRENKDLIINGVEIEIFSDLSLITLQKRKNFKIFTQILQQFIFLYR